MKNDGMCEERKALMKEALNALGKKNLALILHGNSFPSSPGENTGFGTPNSGAAKELFNFIGGVFNGLQLGPYGKTKKGHPSPYTSTVFSNNPLFIDLEQLTKDEWGGILAAGIYQRVCSENPVQDSFRTSYSYIYNAHADAMKSAYAKFLSSSPAKLQKDFETYKKKNAMWLEKDSLYEVISIEYKNDYWPNWPSETDRNLFNARSAAEKKESAARIAGLKDRYASEIDFYAFCQFVAYKQNEATKAYAAKKGIKMIADRQVAFSDRDIWANQSLMLEGWVLGCPPDYFSKDGQAWGFPVMDPVKMFSKDGSLGEAGILMKELYKKIFSDNPGGVRIDHLIGLVDPWVYKVGKKPTLEDGAGRLYSSPEHKELAQYAIASLKDIDEEVDPDKEARIKKLTKTQIKKYGSFIEKIIIAAAEEVGLDKDSIVCEDLGTLTYPVKCVMKQYDLQGMRLTQFVDPCSPDDIYRCCNIPARTWAMAGTHDNLPLSLWAEELVFTHPSYLHALNLVVDLWPDISPEKKEEIVVRLTKDAKFLVQTKFVELFASKSENIQIFFSDFFGIKEVYNRPGTSNDENWSLRLPDNFVDFYEENVKDGYAIDLLPVLKLALEARGEKFAKVNSKLISQIESIL